MMSVKLKLCEKIRKLCNSIKATCRISSTCCITETNNILKMSFNCLHCKSLCNLKMEPNTNGNVREDCVYCSECAASYGVLLKHHKSSGDTR